MAWILSFIGLSAFISASLCYTVTEHPASVAALVASTTARVNCTASLATGDILIWEASHYDTSLPETAIYMGNSLWQEIQDEWNAYYSYDASKKHDLEITRADYGLAGLHQCKLTDGTTLESESYSAEFVVLSELQCPSSGQHGIGDTLSFVCSVEYAGNLVPTLEWWVDGRQVEGMVRDPTQAPPHSPQLLEYVYNFTVGPEHHGAEFICVLHFGTDVDAPDYTRNCSTTMTVTVLHGVTDIKIYPDPDDFEDGVVIVKSGDQLTCTARGIPPPTYFWTRLEGNGGELITGPVLATSDYMIGNNRYTCTAQNNFDGKPQEVETTVHFIVQYASSPVTMICHCYPHVPASGPVLP